MKIKKIAAIGAALAFAVPLAVGATTLSDFVQLDGTTLTSPTIVIGDTAKTEDVIAGIDIGAAMAGYATTPMSVAGSSVSASVTGGVDLSTANTKIRYNDPIYNAKDMLTSEDLANLLASGEITDKNSKTYDYSQYIDLTSDVTTAKVDFSTSGNDLDSAQPLVLVGTSNSDVLYTEKITFSPALDTSTDLVDGKSITLFGQEYTLGSGTELANNSITLYGGGTAVSIPMGETTDVSVSGTTYTIKLIGISTDGNTAYLSVNGGEVQEAAQNGYVTLASGITAYVKSVALFGTGETGSATLKVGTDKIVLKNGDYVRKGTSEDIVKGTYVTLTPATDETVSQVTIKVYAPSSTEDHILESKPFVDPVFGTFEVNFGGLTPALNADTRDVVTLETSDNIVSLGFTDQNGNEAEIEVASNYWGTSSGGETTLRVQDSNDYDYVLVENGTMSMNDYTIINTNGFSHLLQFTSADLVSTTKKVTFEDVISGNTLEATMSSGNNGATSTNFIVDGYTYTVTIESNTSGSETVRIADSVTGLRVFPTMTLKNGEEIALVENVTLPGTGAVTVQLPGSLDTSSTYNIVLGNNATTAYNAGQLQYYYDNATRALTLNTSGYKIADGQAALVLVEEKDSGATRNVIWQRMEVETGSPNKVQIDGLAPQFTGTNSGMEKTSDTKIKKYLDIYGTLVTTNNDAQGTVTYSYPDEQVVANVAVGADPEWTVGSSSSGGTYDVAVPIQNPVAKFAAEVDTASLQGDLILVGGPCVNDLVRELLAPDVTCDTWSYNTGIIKVVENAFSSGKKALIVAGTTKTDTRNLADNYVIKGTLAFEE